MIVFVVFVLIIMFGDLLLLMFLIVIAEVFVRVMSVLVVLNVLLLRLWYVVT